MSYKILEQNGVDNENIDGGAFNNFSAGNRDGILGGVLSECVVAAEGNSIGISPGELIIHGIRVKLISVETLTLSSAPSAPVRYQIIAQVELKADKSIDFSLFIQEVTDLIQDELYASDLGTYQVEIARFTHGINGNIEDLSKTLDIIYGGTGGGGDFEIGNVISNVIDATLPAEAEVNKRIEDGKTYLDFEFYFPDTQEVLQESVTAKNAARAAQAGAETAQVGAEEAQGKAEEAQSATEAAEKGAKASETAAASSAGQAAASATAASQYANAAAGSAGQAQQSAGAAAQSAQDASASADQAQIYMEQAKDYAKKEYKVYNSFDDLPIPGDSAFIYLLLGSSVEENDNYSEYLWISETQKYEFIGKINDVDLANYAQIEGTYPNMSVGLAAGLSRYGYVSVGSSAEKIGWYKIGSASSVMSDHAITGDYSCLFLLNGISPAGVISNYSPSGIIELDGRVLNNVWSTNSSEVKIKLLAGSIDANDLCVVREETELSLYYKTTATYEKQSFTILGENLSEGTIRNFTLLNNSYYGTEAPSGAIYAVNVNRAAYADTAARLSDYYEYNMRSSQLGWYKIAEITKEAITGTPDGSVVALHSTLLFEYDYAQSDIGGTTGKIASGIFELDARYQAGAFTQTQSGIRLMTGKIPAERFVTLFTESGDMEIYYNHVGDIAIFRLTRVSEFVENGDSNAIGFMQEYIGASIPAGTQKACVDNRAAQYDAEGNVIADTYATKKAVMLTGTPDLNDCVPEEVGEECTWYTNAASVTESVLNKPTGASGTFRLSAIRTWENAQNPTVQYRCIQTFQDTQSRVWVRAVDRGGSATADWKPWTEIPNAEGTYPNLTAGLAAALSRTAELNTSGSKAIGWYKLGEITASALSGLVSGSNNYSAILLVNGNGYEGLNNAKPSGIIEIDGRIENGSFNANLYPQIKILAGNLDAQSFCVVCDGEKQEIYYSFSNQYERTFFTVLSETYGNSVVNAFAFSGTYYGSAAPGGATYAINRIYAGYDANGNDIAETYAPKEYCLKTYTGISQLGLSFPCTTVDILNKMENNTFLLLNVEDRAQQVTDAPVSYGLLMIWKKGGNRVEVTFQQSLSNSHIQYEGIWTYESNAFTQISWQAFAYQDGTYPNMSVGNATNATKAKQDENGKNIAETYAPLASPVFTGTPQAPSPAVSDDSSKLATTAWVKDYVQGWTTEALPVYISTSNAGGDATVAVFSSTGKSITFYKLYIGTSYILWFGSFELKGDDYESACWFRVNFKKTVRAISVCDMKETRAGYTPGAVATYNGNYGYYGADENDTHGFGMIALTAQ